MATSHRAPSPGQDRNYGLKGFCLHSSHLITQKNWILHTRRKSSLVANVCSFSPGKDNFVDSLDTFAQLHGCSGTVEGLYTCWIWVEGWNLWTPKSKTFGIALPHVGRYHSEQEQRLPNPWYSWYSKQVPKLYTLYVYILYIFISILLSLFTPSCPTISRQRKRTEGLLWSFACCGTASQVFFLGRCQRDMCFQRAFVPKRPFLRNCLMELYLSNNVIEELVVTLVSFQRKTTAVCSWDLKWRWDEIFNCQYPRWSAGLLTASLAYLTLTQYSSSEVFFFCQERELLWIESLSVMIVFMLTPLVFIPSLQNESCLNLNV